MVYTVQSRINEGFMMDDLRGKHNQHKNLKPALLKDIKKHINMIPKIESRYVRASTSKQYIGGDKTIKDIVLSSKPNVYTKFQFNQLKIYATKLCCKIPP